MGLSYCFRERAGGGGPHPCRDRPYGRRSLSLTELWSVRFDKRTHRSSAYAQTIKKPPRLEKGAQRLFGISSLIPIGTVLTDVVRCRSPNSGPCVLINAPIVLRPTHKP